MMFENPMRKCDKQYITLWISNINNPIANII